jgi:hypothetical protein
MHRGARGYNPLPVETIRTYLPCYRCGYDLTSQPVDGRCPECTLPIVSSLAAALEHAQNPHVALRSSWRVAVALVACASAALACMALQLGAPMLESIDSLLSRSSMLPAKVRLIGWIGSSIAIAIAAVLAHNALRGEPALLTELGRWRRWLLLGAWGWALTAGLAAWMQWRQVWLPDALRSALPWAGLAIQLPGMAAMLSGLHVLLAITGRRSRTYTEAHAARQSVQLLNASAALAIVFSVAAPILQFKLGWIGLAYATRALSGCLAFLLLFGAAYLVANTWWVARALVLPPMRADEALGG